MRRKTLFAVATALVIGLATGYLLWGRRQRETTEGTADEVAAVQKGESLPETVSRIPARRAPGATLPRPKGPTADVVAYTDGGSAETFAPDATTAPAATESAATVVSTQEGAVVALAVGATVIEGEVQFTGAAAAPGKLHREADPYCARREMTDPSVLVAKGKLANVWVHVIKGAPDALPSPTAVEVDQQDCMYTPRVTTAVVGQKVVARNDDPILHNVHTYFGTSTLFNKGMPNEKAAPIEYVTVEPGVIKWKCDVHPWMRGYVGVSSSAYPAVTGGGGR